MVTKDMSELDQPQPYFNTGAAIIAPGRETIVVTGFPRPAPVVVPPTTSPFPPDPAGWLPPGAEDPYFPLREILEAAGDYAAMGKGHERHGQDGAPWVKQRHVRICTTFGAGFALGQAVKKIEESKGMDWDRAQNELYGAITYLATAIHMGRQGVR